MNRLFALVFIFSLAPSAAVIQAQENNADQVGIQSEDPPVNRSPFPRMRGRAVVMDIDARILDNDEVTWNETHQKTTIPGRPVEIKLIGENLVVVAQFTYIQHRGSRQKFLIAQGQIWMTVPNQGVRYQTSIQTIPLEFGETIYYFPLGSFKQGDDASIEVMLTLRSYEDN